MGLTSEKLTSEKRRKTMRTSLRFFRIFSCRDSPLGCCSIGFLSGLSPRPCSPSRGPERRVWSSIVCAVVRSRRRLWGAIALFEGLCHEYRACGRTLELRVQEGSQARPRRKRGSRARVTCRVRGARAPRPRNAPAISHMKTRPRNPKTRGQTSKNFQNS